MGVPGRVYMAEVKVADYAAHIGNATFGASLPDQYPDQVKKGHNNVGYAAVRFGIGDADGSGVAGDSDADYTQWYTIDHDKTCAALPGRVGVESGLPNVSGSFNIYADQPQRLLQSLDVDSDGNVIRPLSPDPSESSNPYGLGESRDLQTALY